MSRGPVSPTRTTHPVFPVPEVLSHFHAPFVPAVSVYSVPTGADTDPLGGPVPVRNREAGAAPTSAAACVCVAAAALMLCGVTASGPPAACREACCAAAKSALGMSGSCPVEGDHAVAGRRGDRVAPAPRQPGHARLRGRGGDRGALPLQPDDAVLGKDTTKTTPERSGSG